MVFWALLWLWALLLCRDGGCIAAAIRAGANAYLKHQYTTVFKVFAIVFLLLLVLAFASGGQMLSRVTPFAFLTGGIFSMLAGFIGMRIATSANARTANAARESLNKGLKVAFSSGSVMGFSVVGVMVMNGMGASFMALFARVGGGIYTKAADVGADLVGKVEAGIPEDDPRNPATIADNVGDNVGDVAGMGADLYESYVGSILATFALGGIAGYGFRGMLLPLLLAVCGILCSILGSFLIRTKENASQEALLRSLRTGTYSAAILAAVLAAPLTKLLIGSWGVYIAILSGLVGGCVIGYFTEYYTSDTYKPTRELAQESETGSATTGQNPLTRGSMASASQAWACSLPWALRWQPTPMVLLPTTPEASPRWRSCPKKCGSAPTRWTPWGTPLPPPAKALPSAPPLLPRWRCW